MVDIVEMFSRAQHLKLLTCDICLGVQYRCSDFNLANLVVFLYVCEGQTAIPLI
jgi:hypothetical protein